MPIKVNNIKSFAVHKGKEAKLFKKETEYHLCKQYIGKDIIKDSHFNPLQIFMLEILDKFNPVIKKYPKLGDKLVSITEKLIKNAEELKTYSKINDKIFF